MVHDQNVHQELLGIFKKKKKEKKKNSCLRIGWLIGPREVVAPDEEDARIGTVADGYRRDVDARILLAADIPNNTHYGMSEIIFF